MIKQNKKINIILHKSKKNLGIAKSIISGMDKMAKKYDKIIVIEDDCIPRKEFFQFFKKMLNKKNIFEKIGASVDINFQTSTKRRI